MIIWEYTPPLWVLVLGILGGAVLGLWSAWRYVARRWVVVVLSLLFLLALAALFWSLLQPGFRDEHRQLTKPRFLIALDTSRSMNLAADADTDTRWERAQLALERAWVDTLAAEAEIELYPFDRRLHPVERNRSAWRELTPDGEATWLRENLHELAGRLRGLNVAGLLLLSDGLDTQEAHDDWGTEPLPFPVYTVQLDDEWEWEIEPDVRIVSVQTPRRVSRGWESEMRVRVAGEGTGDQPLTVELFREDQPVGEMPIQLPDRGGEREVVFALQHDEVGVYTYRVYVEPLPGETRVADNEYQVTVTVTDPRNQILYVEGPPRFEYRFLRRALLAVEHAVPAIFFSGPDGNPVSGTPGAARGADMSDDDLLQFKVVILGNLDADELTERRAANLVRFVEEGGSLVLLGGGRGWGVNGFQRTELETILPVRPGGVPAVEGDLPFAVHLEPAAAAHPAFAGQADFWAQVPPVLTVFPDMTPRAAAEVLVTADTPRGRLPLVVTQRYGQGRVAAMLTDTLWRWQLDPDSMDTRPYLRFWTQLLDWMMPDEEDVDRPDIDLMLSEDQVYRGERIRLSARYFDASLHEVGPPIEVVLTAPDGREVPYAMESRQVITERGRTYPGYVLEFEPDEPGSYVALARSVQGPDRFSSEPVSFNVRPYSPETIPRPSNTDVLRALARASGGQFYESAEEMDRALSRLSLSVEEDVRVTFRSLWKRWPLLVLLMGLLVSTWVFRKWRNMP